MSVQHLIAIHPKLSRYFSLKQDQEIKMGADLEIHMFLTNV